MVGMADEFTGARIALKREDNIKYRETVTAAVAGFLIFGYKDTSRIDTAKHACCIAENVQTMMKTKKPSYKIDAEELRFYRDTVNHCVTALCSKNGADNIDKIVQEAFLITDCVMKELSDKNISF